MLVLCSNGLSSKEMLSHINQYTVTCKTAALVVTADNEYKENNYHVHRCVSELESLNLNVDLFDLDKQSAELLLNYDVVEFIGGNPYYLLHSIREWVCGSLRKFEICRKRDLFHYKNGQNFIACFGRGNCTKGKFTTLCYGQFFTIFLCL